MKLLAIFHKVDRKYHCLQCQREKKGIPSLSIEQPPSKICDQPLYDKESNAFANSTSWDPNCTQIKSQIM